VHFHLPFRPAIGDGARIMSEAPTIPRFFDSAAQRRNRARAASGFAGFAFLKREAVLIFRCASISDAMTAC
jgi:hypothetical protein